MTYRRIEADVAKLIQDSGATVLKDPDAPPLAFDFGIEYQGKRIAIEVKALATTATFTGMFGYQLPAAQDAGYQEFWLISGTPHPTVIPIPQSETIPVCWLTVDEAAETFGAPPPSAEPFKDKRVPLLDVLSGQFSPKIIEAISNDQELEKLLQLGIRQERVTVVFADITSFTEIVHNTESADLNEMLADYYRFARNLTHVLNGTFDKVIGDGVLSVFNYPPINEASSNAFIYATELIKRGRAVLSSFLARSTAVVETGIRVGMATGEVWPIDVGHRIPQVSFVGKPLNLAARLQRHAEVNGLIGCQNTWNLIEAESPDLVTHFCPAPILLEKGQLAGITTAINAKRVSPTRVLSQSE